MPFDPSLGSDTRPKRPNPVAIPRSVDESVGEEKTEETCRSCGRTIYGGKHACDFPLSACARTPDFHPDDRVGDEEPSLGVGERKYLSREEVLAEFPNRFDPFEALDMIIERVIDIDEALHEAPDPMACIGRLADIRGEVLALRAYITGMEK